MPVSLLTVCILAIFTVNSCVKEKVDLSNVNIIYQPGIGVPVANGSWSIQNLLNKVNLNGIIKQYSDSSLYLDYTANIFSKTADSLITLPDTTFTENISSGTTGFPPPVNGGIKFSFNTDYQFTFNNGAILDTINFNGGQLNINVTSSITDTGRIIIQIPSLTKGVNIFQETFVFKNTTGSVFIDTSYLNGYSLQTTTIGGNPNQIPVNYTVILGSTNTPQAAQSINVSIGFKKLSYQSLFGYLGQYSLVNYTGFYQFNFFNNLGNSNIILADPRFNIIFSNSFGLPVSVTLNKVYTLSTKTNQPVPLNFNPSINPIYIASPKNINQTATSKDSIDTINCPNLSQSLAIYPQYLYYGINATANPAGKTHNFVSDSSRLSISLGFEIPLNLKSTPYATADTLGGFLLSQLPDTGNINQVIIKCVFINGMPFDLNTQVILCDSVKGKFIPIDTVINFAQTPNVGSASVIAGKVTKPTERTILINFSDHKRIQKLKNVNCAIINANFSTIGGGKTFVKFYSYYRLNFYLRADVSLIVKSRL
jgi:hypothetical protein